MYDPDTGLPLKIAKAEVGDTWEWSFTNDVGEEIERVTFEIITVNADPTMVETCFRRTRHVEGNTYERCTSRNSNLEAGYGNEMQCLPEGSYNVKLTFNGNNLEEFGFEPSKFGPGTPKVVTEGSTILHPYIDANGGILRGVGQTHPGDTLTVNVSIEDDVIRRDAKYYEGNCKQKIANWPVAIGATVDSNSGGHKHFVDNAQPSFGKFTYASPTISGGELNSSDITVDTDDSGELAFIYKAGKYGLSESIQITPMDSKEHVTQVDPIQVLTAVTGLTGLDLNHPDYLVTGTFISTCDTEHNQSAEIRNSHFVTPFVKARAEELAALFLQFTGTKLSFNDGSLPLGGFFDNGYHVGTDDVTRCHWTHREGHDIDINQAALPILLEGEFYTYNGTPYTNPRKLLQVLATEVLGGIEAIESNIHYRFIP